MYNKSMISLEQAQNAIAAMIADFNRDLTGARSTWPWWTMPETCWHMPVWTAV